MKKCLFVIVLLTLSTLALPAYAGTYFCTGTVTSLEISSAFGGNVYVTGVGGLNTVSICALNGGSGNFPTDACKATYATLLAAKLQGETVSIGFNDNFTCSTQPSGGIPANSSAWSVVAQ